MLIDTLLKLNPDAVVTERDGFVVIDIPSQEDPDPHAAWAQQLEEQEQYEAQDPDAGDSDGGE